MVCRNTIHENLLVATRVGNQSEPNESPGSLYWLREATNVFQFLGSHKVHALGVYVQKIFIAFPRAQVTLLRVIRTGQGGAEGRGFPSLPAPHRDFGPQSLDFKDFSLEPLLSTPQK